MLQLRIGIVGIGFQGSKYVKYFKQREIRGAELTAICDIDTERMTRMDPEDCFLHFEDYRDMLRREVVDAVFIDTPHYLHPVIAEEAVRNGIHTLADKPLGVDALSVRRMETVLSEQPVIFGVFFNQRQIPLYQRIKQVVDRRELGRLRRCIWEITDWYRPQKYYELGGWRSSWKGEGGGLLVNQCAHNIDILCWLFGRPARIQSYVGYGDYHHTMVDDNVVANLLYDDGFVCTLISSTGEAPGTNRLEISGTKGKLVFDKFTKLKYTWNDPPEDEFSKTAETPKDRIKFGKPGTRYSEELFEEKVDSHHLCIQNFVDAVREGGSPAAVYQDGLSCVEVINGIYYSDWKNTTVEIPVDEEQFYACLRTKWE